MGLVDRFKRMFRRRAPNQFLVELERFAEERKGVEGYIEPRTATSPVTLLLVDRDGDNRRAPVEEPEDAAAFCEKRGIPIYDAAVVGYPRRMREFEAGRRPSVDALDERFADIERHFEEGE